jgi:dipeptidase E
MYFYLSSYLIGNQTDYLGKQSSKYTKIAYISNAMDFVGVDPERLKKSDIDIIKSLSELGFEVEVLDLKDYFNQKQKLSSEIQKFNGVFVRGGNVFALRQAMKLSGLDEILIEYSSSNKDFLYMGFSAGICVLAPSLKGVEIVDPLDISLHLPEAGLIWEGLGILNFAIAPHYRSEHKESELIEKMVEYYIENKILFKALKDGEVLILG